MQPCLLLWFSFLYLSFCTKVLNILDTLLKCTSLHTHGPLTVMDSAWLNLAKSYQRTIKWKRESDPCPNPVPWLIPEAFSLILVDNLGRAEYGKVEEIPELERGGWSLFIPSWLCIPNCLREPAVSLETSRRWRNQGLVFYLTDGTWRASVQEPRLSLLPCSAVFLLEGVLARQWYTLGSRAIEYYKHLWQVS